MSRLEYTRQDTSKKQETCVDGPSPEFQVKPVCMHAIAFPFLKELRHGFAFRLNFSKSSFAILVNLLHPQPSLFPFGLFLPLFSALANYYLKVSFN